MGLYPAGRSPHLLRRAGLRRAFLRYFESCLLHLSPEDIAAAEACGVSFLPASAAQVQRLAMQRKVFYRAGAPILATRGDGLFETVGTLQQLIEEGRRQQRDLSAMAGGGGGDAATPDAAALREVAPEPGPSEPAPVEPMPAPSRPKRRHCRRSARGSTGDAPNRQIRTWSRAEAGAPPPGWIPIRRPRIWPRAGEPQDLETAPDGGPGIAGCRPSCAVFAAGGGRASAARRRPKRKPRGRIAASAADGRRGTARPGRQHWSTRQRWERRSPGLEVRRPAAG